MSVLHHSSFEHTYFWTGGANSVEQYWELLNSGREAIADIPASRFSLAGRLGLTQTF